MKLQLAVVDPELSKRARRLAAAVTPLVVALLGCGPPGPPPVAHGPAAFWDPAHYGKNDLLTDARAIRVNSDPEVSRAQVPGYPDYFIGRLPMKDVNTPTASYGLVLRKMDWTTYTLSVVGNSNGIFHPDPYPKSLDDSNQIGGGLGAYDPDIVSFNGELWVAFECVHTGFLYDGQQTTFPKPIYSACMGVLDLTNGIEQATLTRTYVAIEGQPDANGNYHSASVPRLLISQGRAYLYWTAVQYDPTYTWVGMTMRGTELFLNQYNQLMPRREDGSSGSVHSFSSTETTETWGLNPLDSTANSMVDGFHVTTDGDWIYAVGALGGSGCLLPNDAELGCYRLSIARAREPLAHDAFNDDQLPGIELPSNPVSYSFFFTDPLGSRFFMAGYGALQGPPLYPENVLGVDEWRTLAFPLP